MSGIAGAFQFNQKPVEIPLLEAMKESLRHRGHDNAGLWSDGPVGFVHCMTWTTPESTNEILPFAKRNCVITADARIDNREELFRLLALRGAEKDTSDSELILVAYNKWGRDCPEKLLGDFAFAIWDADQHAVFCARDVFGVRPFYYFIGKEAFLFASEIRGLFCSPEVPQERNDLRIADYLLGINSDKSNTFYENVKRLPPASSIWVTEEGGKINNYWSLNLNKEIRMHSDEDYAEQFRELFYEAVRCRLRSAYPVGSMLSGGLDSSSIVSVVRDLQKKNGKQDLHTFSYLFDEVRKSDERDFINEVVSIGNVTPHYIWGDKTSPFTDIDQVLWYVEEPFFAPNLFLSWAGWKEIRQLGVRVILDGFLGDNVVSHGTVYLSELARKWQLFRLYQEINGVANLYHYNAFQTFQQFFWHESLKPYTPNFLKKVWRKAHGRSAEKTTQIPRIINPEFAHKVRLLERIRHLKHSFDHAANVRLAHYQDLNSGDIPFALEAANKAQARFAVEVRFPFADRRLVEYCFALPPDQKLDNGWNRVVLRRALDGVLPEKIQWRTSKGNLGPNFKHGLVSQDEDILKETIISDPQLIGDYVDTKVLNNMYSRSFEGKASDDEITYVWLSVLLDRWLRKSQKHTSPVENL